MMPSRKHLLWAWPLLALFAAGCGQTSPTDSEEETDTSTDTSTVTVTIAPSPTTASGSPDSNFAWTGAFVATISNTNSTPITINSISADLQQSSGGIVITPIPDTDEAFRFEVRAPHNRVDINSTMAVPFTFFYTLPNRGRESMVSLSFAVTTDEGASGTVTASVKIE